MIPVVIFSTGSRGRDSYPLLYLPGGPGHPGLLVPQATSRVWSLTFKTHTWLDDREVIVFDYRGTGSSQPSLDCEKLSGQSLGREWRSAVIRNIRRCKESLSENGINTENYDTAEIADDIYDLRVALGISKWDIWARSYGTRVAFEVLKKDLDGARSVIMEGVSPPNVSDWRYTIARDFRTLLERLFLLCRNDTQCSQENPYLEQNFAEVVTYLRQKPQRLRITSYWPIRRNVTVDLDDTLFLDFMHSESLSIEGIRRMPMYIRLILERDFSQYEALITEYLAQETLSFWSTMHYFAVVCNDLGRIDDQRWHRARQEHPLLAALLFGPGVCDQIVARNRPISNGSFTRYTVPTLMLAGSFDPVTPVRWAEGALEYFDRGHLFVFPARSHDVSHSKCAQNLMKAFLDAPQPRPNHPCFNQMDRAFTFANDLGLNE